MLSSLQAQYNAPLPDLGQLGVPAYRVRVACEYLSSPTLSTPDLLAGMTAALAVSTVTQGQCLDTTGMQAGLSSDLFSYQVNNLPSRMPALHRVCMAHVALRRYRSGSLIISAAIKSGLV